MTFDTLCNGNASHHEYAGVDCKSKSKAAHYHKNSFLIKENPYKIHHKKYVVNCFLNMHT